jgi:hypothetical protein
MESETLSMQYMLSALAAGDLEAAYFWAWINRELWDVSVKASPIPSVYPVAAWRAL